MLQVISFIKLQNANNYMVKNDEKWFGELSHFFSFLFFCEGGGGGGGGGLSYVWCLEEAFF